MARERFKRERTVDDIRRKASEGSRDYDNLFTGDVKLFKPAEGENSIRIMPATWGTQPYSKSELDKMSDEEYDKLCAEDDRFEMGWDLPLFVHYGVGPDNASYLCREKMLGEPCPICAAKLEARDPDEADALSPTKRGLCWIIDRNNEKEGPQLWSMPFSKIRNEIYARSTDKKTGTPIFVDDVEEGFDIIFNRAGKDERTNYTGVEVDRDATPLHDDEKKQDKWLDYTMDHRLPDVLNFYPPEHIEKVLFGKKSARREADADAGGEEETSSRSSRRGDRGERSSSRDRTRQSRSGEDATERDYRDEPDAPAADESRGTRRRSPRSEEPEVAPPEEDRSSRRRGRAETPREAPDADPDAEPEPDAGPTEQARSRLRGLRSRRGGG